MRDSILLSKQEAQQKGIFATFIKEIEATLSNIEQTRVEVGLAMTCIPPIIVSYESKIEPLLVDLLSIVKKETVDVYSVLMDKTLFCHPSEKPFYKDWYTRFIYLNIKADPFVKGHDANLHADWITKQINKGRVHGPSQTAFLQELRNIWLYGGLNEEMKDIVFETLQEYDEETDSYATLTKALMKNGIVKSLVCR